MLKTLQRFGYLKNNSYLCSVEKKKDNINNLIKKKGIKLWQQKMNFVHCL